jgi:Carbohydrate-selective porin, OprB family/S-layer homology domain
VKRKTNQLIAGQKLTNGKQCYFTATAISLIGIGLLVCQGVKANETEVNDDRIIQPVSKRSIDTELLSHKLFVETNAETRIISQAVTLDERTNTNTELLQQVDRYNNENSIGQVNNVSQLRDVSPSDWAYEALRSLVENYGCIAGYPNGTFRGSRAMTRYEFAAGLNACLNQIEQSIASGATIVREDLDKLQKLTEEFRTELTTLNGRVDKLEQRVAFLEDHQFSTTTKLSGEVVFGVAGVFTGDDANGNEIDNVPVFGHRTRLGFSTSFNGNDLLYFQLNSGNLPNFSRVTNTFEGNLGLIDNQSNNVNLLVAFYSLPLGDRTKMIIEATGGYVYDFVDTISPLDKLNDSASGAISAFGLRNPIYNTVSGAGVGIQSQLSDNFEVSLGYLAPTAQDPSSGNGLFDGAYSAIGQVVFKPSDRFKLGFAYVRTYNSTDTLTGSNLSNFRSFTTNTIPTTSDAFGLQTSWQIGQGFILSGWAGYSNVKTFGDITTTDGKSGDLDIWNWAVTLAFPDLGKEGNLGGIVVGIEPKVTSSNVILNSGLAVDRDTSLHIEAFYQYQLNDNIAITPGIIWITAPNHDDRNADTVLGIVRTTFTF